uniref:Uncharacterized protein n=1 Tax=Oncorhynchus mykiss TaxID=8022 RepID=A0A8K9V5E4_ONCMY
MSLLGVQFGLFAAWMVGCWNWLSNNCIFYEKSIGSSLTLTAHTATSVPSAGMYATSTSPSFRQTTMPSELSINLGLKKLKVNTCTQELSDLFCRIVNTSQALTSLNLTDGIVTLRRQNCFETKRSCS